MKTFNFKKINLKKSYYVYFCDLSKKCAKIKKKTPKKPPKCFSPLTRAYRGLFRRSLQAFPSDSLKNRKKCSSIDAHQTACRLKAPTLEIARSSSSSNNRQTHTCTIAFYSSM
jgi:hypothetical protein